MAYDIIVNGQVISLPSIDQDPNWAAGVVRAFQAIAEALNASVGPYDLVPQEYLMVSNANSNVAIPSLSFPIANVRSAQVSYAVFRKTDSASQAESGILELVYNAEASVGQKWQLSRTFTGSSTVTFTVDDVGQISFSSVTLAGTNYIGNIVFSATTLLQSY